MAEPERWGVLRQHFWGFVIQHLQKTLKRDYVQVTPLPNAQTVLELIGSCIEDYNTNHPHSGLKMRSPREFIAAQTATA